MHAQRPSHLVSIIVPYGDASPDIFSVVESAVTQSHSDIEVIVVADSRTADKLPDLSDTFGHKINIHTVDCQGASFARNHGLRVSAGSFVQFLDANTVLKRHKLAKQLAKFDRDRCDVVFSRHALVGDGRPERPSQLNVADPKGIDSFIYCLSQRIAPGSSLYRRSVLENAGGFRLGVPYAREFDLHLRLAAAGAVFDFHDEVLCANRFDPCTPLLRNHSHPAGGFLKILMELTENLLTSAPYQMNSVRKRALAQALALYAAQASRNGAQSLPTRAYRIARRLDPEMSSTSSFPPALRATASMAGTGDVTADAKL